MFEIALGISGSLRERVQPMEVAIELVFAIALFIYSIINIIMGIRRSLNVNKFEKYMLFTNMWFTINLSMSPIIDRKFKHPWNVRKNQMY